PPRPSPFPYTTLFRSPPCAWGDADDTALHGRAPPLLPLSREPGLRRPGRAHRVHAARPRRAPALVHPGGVPEIARALPAGAGPARRPARDLPRLRPLAGPRRHAGLPRVRPALVPH